MLLRVCHSCKQLRAVHNVTGGLSELAHNPRGLLFFPGCLPLATTLSAPLQSSVNLAKGLSSHCRLLQILIRLFQSISQQWNVHDFTSSKHAHHQGDHSLITSQPHQNFSHTSVVNPGFFHEKKSLALARL